MNAQTSIRLLPRSLLAFAVLLCLLAIAAPHSHAADNSSSSFSASLALRTDRIVADSAHPALGWLTQIAPAAFTSKGALTLKLSLVPWEGEPKPVKDLGVSTVYGGDFAKTPFPFSADMRGVADGFYRYVAEIFDGDTSLAKLGKPVVLVAGLDAKQADFTARLAKIDGHESAKASVLYPFDLARVINLGKRVYGSNNRNPEFGLTQAGVPKLYDFSAGLKNSAALLAALEDGRDPVWRAGGERVRHYHMPEADEILPYRVFMPSKWDGKSALPLVFVLHGNSRDQDFYFERDGRIIPKTAEKHGFMLVAPLGYSPNGGYNYVPFDRERGPRGEAAATNAPQQFGPGIAGGVNDSTIPALVRTEWSEQDAMRVLDLVRKEYPIDPKRTFLFGYSAGGQGAHYLSQKFAENWTAIAIGGSGAAAGSHYDFGRLKGIPMFLFSGSADPVVGATRAMSAALKQRGIDATFKEYPGASHDTAPGVATPDFFEFFAGHGK